MSKFWKCESVDVGVGMVSGTNEFSHGMAHALSIIMSLKNFSDDTEERV